MLVTLDRNLRRALEDHAHSDRPREACGLLGAREGDDPGTIRLVRYLPVRNLAADRDHFAIDAVAIARADRELRAAGLELGGVFHSHPDQPPIPSDRDQAAAWPGMVYLILGVARDGHSDLRAWIAGGDAMRRLELR